MNARMIAISMLLLGGTAASAAVSTEAVPANNPSLRHNPAATIEARAQDKISLQQQATPVQLRERDAYFDFDRSDLHTEDLPMLRVHASYLLMHPEAKVKLVGHADPRGSAAYNLALGEQRADAVRDYFVQQGVAARRIEVSSAGRVDTATSRKTEAAMARNRRVEIDYL